MKHFLFRFVLPFLILDRPWTFLWWVIWFFQGSLDGTFRMLRLTCCMQEFYCAVNLNVFQVTIGQVCFQVFSKKVLHMKLQQFNVAADYSNCRNSSPLPKSRKTNGTKLFGESALKTNRYLVFGSTDIMSEVPLEGLRKNLFKWRVDSSSSLGSVT